MASNTDKKARRDKSRKLIGPRKQINKQESISPISVHKNPRKEGGFKVPHLNPQQNLYPRINKFSI